MILDSITRKRTSIVSQHTMFICL